MATVGASEFGGGAGMVQPLQEGHETNEQQLWEIYATNSSGTDGSEQIDPSKVGVPETYQQSYSDRNPVE